MTTYVIDGTLSAYSFEDDSDYHLVVNDAQGRTMIVEVPHPDCVGSTSPFRNQIASARSTFNTSFRATTFFKTTNTPVRVTGVGFWDDIHGQRGVAVNGIELHPVLDLQFNPAGVLNNLATAVEYYYAAWGFYFMTAFPDEIAVLDGGAFGGVWQRTGQSFNVWPQNTGSASATCRFFSTSFAPKSSHFYTPFSAECATVKTNPDWQYEAIAFYIQLADIYGYCPVGTIPLYRLYNNGMGGAPNHRYTTSVTVFSQMVAAGWVFEGNGNTKVFACVPQ